MYGTKCIQVARKLFCVQLPFIFFTLFTVGCDRKLIYHNSENEKVETPFSNATSSRRDLHELNTSSPSGYDFEWHGDSASRLVFYARAPSNAVARVQTKSTSAEDVDGYYAYHFLAYDIPWRFSLDKESKPSISNVVLKDNLPPPCVGATCTKWSQVRSIDLGRCSIEIPYGKIEPFGPNPVLGMVGQPHLQLASVLLEGVLEEAKFNKIVRDSGASV